MMDSYYSSEEEVKSSSRCNLYEYFIELIAYVKCSYYHFSNDELDLLFFQPFFTLPEGNYLFKNYDNRVFNNYASSSTYCCG